MRLVRLGLQMHLRIWLGRLGRFESGRRRPRRRGSGRGKGSGQGVRVGWVRGGRARIRIGGREMDEVMSEDGRETQGMEMGAGMRNRDS